MHGGRAEATIRSLLNSQQKVLPAHTSRALCAAESSQRIARYALNSFDFPCCRRASPAAWATKPRKINMSPSQIVKSAYARACRAGYPESLKAFARALRSEWPIQGKNDVFIQFSKLDRQAASEWLSSKLAQRKQARQCARSQRRGHNDVHQRQHARSIEHCTGRGTPFVSREGARS